MLGQIYINFQEKIIEFKMVPFISNTYTRIRKKDASQFISDFKTTCITLTKVFSPKHNADLQVD